MKNRNKTVNFNKARIWVDFGVGKPISATWVGLYFFMKLGINIYSLDIVD